jgi:hypothetical protein
LLQEREHEEKDEDRLGSEGSSKTRPGTFWEYHRGKGYMLLTVDMYVDSAGRYLTSRETIPEFLNGLHDRHLARNTINNYIIAIKAYHRMLDQPLDDLNILRNYYFEEEDIRRIFEVVKNLKHKAMLTLMFFTCLRPQSHAVWTWRTLTCRSSP